MKVRNEVQEYQNKQLEDSFIDLLKDDDNTNLHLI